ncbi:MAG TPA: nuclear transport factor 2 family protein [Candidatus Acidoferrum sp.]
MHVFKNGYAVTIFLVVFTLLVGIPGRSSSASPAAQTGDTAVSQVDHALVSALAKKDSALLEKFFDEEFTWTNSAGKTLTRPDVLGSLPHAPMPDENGAKLEHRDYGQVVAILSAREKIHVLRVWVKRGNGWHLLVYHEVSQAEQAQASPGTGVKECENPCKTVPYHPKNESEQAVIEAWQALETGVTTHDAELWSEHVDEEFVTVSSSSDHPVFKSDRIATLNLQKQTGYGSAPAPLVSAQMFDFGNTIVMTCLHQPYKGKPVHVSRVWIKRKGKWLMTISFHATVQESAAKS